MRVLIADDDAFSRKLARRIIESFSHEVIEAEDGDAALIHLLGKDPPPLAVIDWMMPKIDGMEVIRRVRSHATAVQPYLIMLTAMDEKNNIIAGLNAGANDYLSKPCDPGELRARLEVGRRMIQLQAELVESRDRLAYQATHDALTGLLNRRAILERLNEEIIRALRQRSRLAVGICDIDHFKNVNDHHGHQTGDDVLCAVANRFTANLRPYDQVGRIGGEEFLIIAPLTEDGFAGSVFEKLNLVIAEGPLPTRLQPISATVSIGVANYQPGMTSDALLADADTALYEAKAAGRNRVILHGN